MYPQQHIFCRVHRVDTTRDPRADLLEPLETQFVSHIANCAIRTATRELEAASRRHADRTGVSIRCQAHAVSSVRAENMRASRSSDRAQEQSAGDLRLRRRPSGRIARGERRANRVATLRSMCLPRSMRATSSGPSRTRVHPITVGPRSHAPIGRPSTADARGHLDAWRLCARGCPVVADGRARAQKRRPGPDSPTALASCRGLRGSA